jgi:hypothetical protein
MQEKNRPQSTGMGTMYRERCVALGMRIPYTPAVRKTLSVFSTAPRRKTFENERQVCRQIGSLERSAKRTLFLWVSCQRSEFRPNYGGASHANITCKPRNRISPCRPIQYTRFRVRAERIIAGGVAASVPAASDGGQRTRSIPLVQRGSWLQLQEACLHFGVALSRNLGYRPKTTR